MNKINKIVAKDFYGDHCLNDKILGNDSDKRRPQGWVEIYEIDESNNENLIGKHNLVVYQGRELIAQRMFFVSNPQTVTNPDEYISWFGVGSGGVNVGDPFNPSPPVSTDTNIYNELPISAIDATCGDFHDGFYYKKPIESIDFEQDPYNNNAWLIVKTVSRVSLADANGLQISEAGLFSAAGGAIPNHSGPFHLFSRVTFPTVVKVDTRQLLFIWYIYF